MTPSELPHRSDARTPRSRRTALIVVLLAVGLSAAYVLLRGHAGQPSPAASPAVVPPSPRVASEGSEMISIPGGTLQLGSNDSVDDNPSHSVTLAPYEIARHPITNAQFRGFVEASHYAAGTEWAQNATKYGDRAPVMGVSWNDAKAYCEWAHMRLPTEDEWELAARGTDGRLYPWGNEWDAAMCRNSSGTSKQSDGPVPVGSYPRAESPFHCLDMAGNVWQWTSSRWDSKHDWCVLRGGSWYDFYPWHFRAAFRISGDPALRGSYNGFRVARSLGPNAATRP